MAAPDDQIGTKHGQRGFRPLLAATGISVSGDGALNTAAPLLAAALTSDPVAVAMVTAAVYLPWFVVGLPAGVLVDRWPKRSIMVWTSLLQAAVLGLFCGVMATGHLVYVALVVTVVLVNAGQCFYSPASQSAIPAIIGRDKEDLRRANGRYLAIDGIGRAMVGPFGGAWLFTVGRVLPFLADGVSFAISALLLRRLPNIPPSTDVPESVLVAVRTGVRQLYRIRELLVLTLGTMAYNIGYFCAYGVLVLYAQDVLHVGAIGFGALFTVLAAAGILTGWFGTGLVRGLSDTQVQAITLAIPGAAWLVVPMFPTTLVTLAVFACIGSTAVLGSTTINSATQRLSPAGSLGRITSIVHLFAFGGSGAGALIGGWIAANWGLLAPMIAAGILQLMAAIAVWILRTAHQTT